MTINSERLSPLEISPEEFRKLGHNLIDEISNFLETIRARKVNPGESPESVRGHLGFRPLPQLGESPSAILDHATKLLVEHSLLNGHPSFLGYITSSAAPIGALGDLLSSSVNPNVGNFQLGPLATEIEVQTIRWIAEMIGYPADCGGLLVSGGNMANFVCFVTARHAKTTWNIRKEGVGGKNLPQMRVYTSTETHTWIQKAADLFGLGTDAISWIPTDSRMRMDVSILQSKIEEDKARGMLPFLVVGTAGSVGTGAIDPLEEIAEVCRRHDTWFHIDGAYGGFAAVLPDAPRDLKVLDLADSIAVDPHKWLYAPLEAGCVLVRKKNILIDTFSYHPPYYKFEGLSHDPPTNFYEMGPQNSRGFRALKVWMALRQAGREGYIRMIAEDCALAEELFEIAGRHPDLQACTQELSIATFRYVPRDLDKNDPNVVSYLNELNTELLTRIQNGGKVFLSNALLNGMFVLRACVVNFRTTRKEIQDIPEIVVKDGNELDKEMRGKFQPAGRCIP